MQRPALSGNGLTPGRSRHGSLILVASWLMNSKDSLFNDNLLQLQCLNADEHRTVFPRRHLLPPTRTYCLPPVPIASHEYLLLTPTSLVSRPARRIPEIPCRGLLYHNRFPFLLLLPCISTVTWLSSRFTVAEFIYFTTSSHLHPVTALKRA